MTLRRLVLLVLVLVVVGLSAYTAWTAWQLKDDLEQAETSARAFRSALESDDAEARQAALGSLTEQADDARSRADGVWWSALTHVPLIGDDARGLRALSRALDTIATGAAAPLSDSVDALDHLVTDGRVDLRTVSSLRKPVREAHASLTAADEELDHDSSGYVGALRTRYDDFAKLVHDLRSGLSAAQTAVDVAPRMLGANGPQDYLLIFQNNAEIRATGGMPGSWALLRADAGKVDLVHQGTASDFPRSSEPVLPLTDAEIAVYGREFGLYFQDPGFSPDFPRAAELWRAHWARSAYGDRPLRGVIAIDPVALSYLLEGTGPVAVGDVTLTSENVIESLLNKPYVELGAVAQDRFFALASRSIFEAVTTRLSAPIAFVQGVNRAVDEGRLRIASFVPSIKTHLAGNQVAGALAADDGATPHVDIGLNDLTGSKMSYYLRYDAEVDATGCRDDRQTLTGALRLRQSIAPERAAELPDYVTGGGDFGTDPGSQYVMVRIYGPWGGSLDEIRIDGRTLKTIKPVDLGGRPVASVDVLMSSVKDVLVTWDATTGAGQTARGELGMTPSAVAGSDRDTFASAC